MTPAEFAAAQRFRERYNIAGAVTDIAKLMKDGPQSWWESEDPPPNVPPTAIDDLRTEHERITDLKSEADKAVKRAAGSCGIWPREPDYSRDSGNSG